MRGTAQPGEIPELMRDAWHLDAHRGPMPALLEPAELVSAIFKIPVRELAVDDEISTAFGKFYVDDLSSTPNRRSILLRTSAPGLVSYFGIAVHDSGRGSCEALLLNSVHPNSWLGRAYFRVIEVGHHLVMEVALRRLARAARCEGPAA